LAVRAIQDLTIPLPRTGRQDPRQCINSRVKRDTPA
jgi:hypothetical protein